MTKIYGFIIFKILNYGEFKMRILEIDEEISFNTIKQIQDYLFKRISELRKLSVDENQENPYIFMGISAIFDLLSFLPYSNTQMKKWNNKVSIRYKQFLKDYVFDNINTNLNLSELFYKRVRCGLDHSFSVGSDKIYVLLSHERSINPEEICIKDINGNLENGVIFKAFGMVDLLIHSISKIFNEVNNGKISQQQIINRFCEKKPLSRTYKDIEIQVYSPCASGSI